MSDVPAAEPLIELDSAPADDDPRWRRTPARSMLGAGLGLLLGGLLFMARRLRDAFRDATFTDGELRFSGCWRRFDLW